MPDSVEQVVSQYLHNLSEADRQVILTAIQAGQNIATLVSGGSGLPNPLVIQTSADWSATLAVTEGFIAQLILESISHNFSITSQNGLSSVSVSGAATAMLLDAPNLTVGQGGSDKVGFNGATPIVKPTGVAVTAAAIHAALVNLGLISA